MTRINLILLLGLVLPSPYLAAPADSSSYVIIRGPSPTCLPPCEDDEVCRYEKSEPAPGEDFKAYCFADD
jgi:hypothetical protein